jgi:hypothetical protein
MARQDAKIRRRQISYDLNVCMGHRVGGGGRVPSHQSKLRAWAHDQSPDLPQRGTGFETRSHLISWKYFIPMLNSLPDKSKGEGKAVPVLK